jgi:hypothetical protein
MRPKGSEPWATLWQSLLDVGCSQVQELNKGVVVAVHEGPLDEATVASHNVVVFTRGYGDWLLTTLFLGVLLFTVLGYRPLDDMLNWNAFCRQRSIGFIMVHMRGPAGHCFSDFGDAFTVRVLVDPSL